jgi:hypothetical protein
MMTLSRLACVFVAGCSFLGIYTPKDKTNDPEHPTYSPPMFEDYVASIRHYEKDVPVAKIPRSLKIEAPVELTARKDVPTFSLVKIDDAKLCIQGETTGQRQDRPGQEIADQAKDTLELVNLSFRGITSLEAERKHPLFPIPDGATTLDKAEVVSDEVKDFDNTNRGTVERHRVVTWRLCAPRPKITDATTFIAVTAHFRSRTAPEYESLLDYKGNVDPHQEEENQERRLSPDMLVLVAITDGAVDLTK